MKDFVTILDEIYDILWVPHSNNVFLVNASDVRNFKLLVKPIIDDYRYSGFASYHCIISS